MNCSCPMMFSYLFSLLLGGSARNSSRVRCTALRLVLLGACIGAICPSFALCRALILSFIVTFFVVFFSLFFSFFLLFFSSHNCTCNSEAIALISCAILDAPFLDPVAFATRAVSGLDMYPVHIEFFIWSRSPELMGFAASLSISWFWCAADPY